ncbi:MAG: AraC family transcriptional regulator [Halomonadaceae bacterium]|nr:MAG: AraC family transcriptional regulator [Halomonadaceae bacterium]
MSAPHRRRIPTSFAVALYEYLDQQGVDSAAVLASPRPPVNTALNADIPISDWCQLLASASRHLADPRLGLHLGQTIIPRHIGVLGYVIMASENLGEALKRLHRYQRLIYDVTPLEVRGAGERVELVWGAEHGRPGPLVDETAITALIHLCRRLTASRLAPLSVSFINPQPEDTQPYEDFFGCPVHFAQPETIVSLSTGTLLQPMHTADPAMLTMLEQQADALLARLPTQSPLVEQVRRRISYLLPEQAPELAKVADAMGISTRTLQRQLAQAGTSFLQEVAAVRCEIAERYLRETKLGLVDIALLLGYSEHSAFTRSFIRWTGSTPMEYRQLHRAGGTNSP